MSPLDDLLGACLTALANVTIPSPDAADLLVTILHKG